MWEGVIHLRVIHKMQMKMNWSSQAQCFLTVRYAHTEAH